MPHLKPTPLFGVCGMQESLTGQGLLLALAAAAAVLCHTFCLTASLLERLNLLSTLLPIPLTLLKTLLQRQHVTGRRGGCFCFLRHIHHMVLRASYDLAAHQVVSTVMPAYLRGWWSHAVTVISVPSPCM